MAVIIAALIFVFITGLCIGSFLNVVILRALSNESIVFPASKCPKCQNHLKWWHNIPVLSYILLGGKCAYCKERISFQYPLIELFTGIIFVLIFLRYGIKIDTLFMLAISSLLIVIAGTDIKEKVVFDAHVFSLIGVTFLYAIYSAVIYFMQNPGFTKFMLLHNPLTNAIVGALAGVIIMEVLARLGYLFAGARAFGEGDTFIAAGLGAIFGWYSLIFVLLVSVIIQVIFFLPMFLKGLWDNKEIKTLVTFLIFAVYSVLLCVLQAKGILNEGILFVIAAVILGILGIMSSVLILNGLKDHPENGTYLPFGPAMVAAALIFLIV